MLRPLLKALTVSPKHKVNASIEEKDNSTSRRSLHASTRLASAWTCDRCRAACLPMENYTNVQLVDSGSQGKVYTAQNTVDGMVYIMKRVRIVDPEAQRSALMLLSSSRSTAPLPPSTPPRRRARLMFVLTAPG